MKKLLLLTVLACAAPLLHAQTEQEPIVELETFYVKGLDRETSTTLSSMSFPVSSIYGEDLSLLDLPRSVTLVTTEAFNQYGIESFQNLDRAAPGSVQDSNFGLIGTPELRGDRAGVFFYGMERPFIGNKVPLSFGSFESMEIIRGVAPAHFGATAPGGIVNLVPKAPYFDKKRTSVKVEAGTYNQFRIQADHGGPAEVMGKSAAYRTSFTLEKGDSYYDNIEKDFASLYVAGAIELQPDVTLFAAMEYYNFETNENAGWNRVTQDLIDNGAYIRGETVNLVDDVNYYGTAARYGFRGKDVPPTSNPNGVLTSLFIPGVMAAGEWPTDGDGEPIKTGAIVVPSDFLATLSADQVALLDDVNGQIVYTPEYLAGADGVPNTADDNPVATTEIDGGQVLSDPLDYANSEGILIYLDFVNRRNENFIWKNQLFLEGMDANKLSSYNYANNTDQFVLEDKFTVEQNIDTLAGVTLLYGANLRYNYGSRIADASPEPFSRRDLDNPIITGNSRVLSGDQNAVGGPEWWQGGDETDLYTAGVFVSANLRFTDFFSTVIAGRYEYNSFETVRPDYPYMRDPGSELADGEKSYWNASISPNLKLNDQFSLYATIHNGASILFGNSGTILGEGNFADTEFYEAGVKVNTLNRKLSGALAVYYYDREKYDDLTGAVTPYYGKGVELEMVYEPTANLAIVGNLTWQEQHLRSEPGFRFFDTADGWMLPLIAGAGYYTSGTNELVETNNPDYVQVGSPDIVANLFVVYEMENGFGISAGPSYRSDFWLNWERTLKAPSALVWNGNVFYSKGSYEIMLQMTNITSEDYFYGGDGFAANALVHKAEAFQARLKFTYKF